MKRRVSISCEMLKPAELRWQTAFNIIPFMSVKEQANENEIEFPDKPLSQDEKAGA